MQKKYVVVREGFLMNMWKSVDETVFLHPKQARYLILSGQIAEPKVETATAEPQPEGEG